MTVGERIRRARIAVMRSLLALRRPSSEENAQRLRERGESTDSLIIREVQPADIPALAQLHVTTWNDTYAPMMSGPPVSVREAQWREAFDQSPKRWFAFVVVQPDGRLIGFAKGVLPDKADGPGELNKLFLLREYQRLGIGRRLLTLVAKRFLDLGVTSMSAYVSPENPSGRFFERMGGVWLIEDGKVNFTWYVWKSLEPLIA